MDVMTISSIRFREFLDTREFSPRHYLRKVLHYTQNWDAKAICNIFELAAEYHDLGKLNQENQNTLSSFKKAARLPVPHADAGVAHLMSKDAWTSALLIYAHHAGLPDIGDINIRGIRNAAIEKQVNLELPALLKRHKTNICSAIRDKSPIPSTQKLTPADVRLLFSCLTHADHGDAARASDNEPQWIHAPKLKPVDRLKALQSYIEELSANADPSERNDLRTTFFNICSNETAKKPITLCDAPVGTGKTTALMAQLLNIAAQHKLRRIFVILPFTNIISQSVATYRKALTLENETPEEIVAEIHHRADFENTESRKLTALWDAPIIVTTAVAFFETLASANSATLRRLQNLPGSAIFLDEAHAMLPIKLLPLSWRWIRHTASSWSCHWILASGSLCHFWALEEFQSEEPCKPIPNILPPKQQEKLQQFEIARIRHKYKNAVLNLDELALWLKEDIEGPIIVVLNTVHTAAAAAKAATKVFGNQNVMHLSTSLTPKDRERTLKTVHERLENNKLDSKWCLIATSCVEAGVDLSFRTGIRECASLLSLLQLAGRVNRNSEYPDADVWTINLNCNDCGVVQNPAFTCSSRILRDYFEQNIIISPELCTDAMKKEIREQNSFSLKLNVDETNYSFKTVNKEFRVIDNSSRLTVIDKKLVQDINNYKPVSWQAIQSGSVQIRKHICEKLRLEESHRFPGVLLWPEGAKYSSFLGYMEAVLELDEINQNLCAII